MVSEARRIIRSVEVLSGSYLPEVLHARKEQLQELRALVCPSASTRAPRHVWLFGKPGTGKTSAAAKTLNEIREKESVRSAYVNCWKHSTLYAVVDVACSPV